MPVSTRLLLLTSLLAAPGVIPLYLFYRTTTRPGSAIVGENGIPSALQESKLVKLLNPRGNPLMADSWTYRISRSQIRSLSSSATSELSEEDEERLVLARFVRGFFNGRAFAFEQWLFNTFKETLHNYLGLGVVDPENAQLKTKFHEEHVFWTAAEWPIDDYAPYGASFMHAFMLLDSGRDRIYADDRLPRNFAAVAFGSNRPTAGFVGTHFFSVIRRPGTEKRDQGEDVVFDLNTWSWNCDPSERGIHGSQPRWLWKWLLPPFHWMYERALIADAIDAVRSE